jgi:quercetin dioxygenase-like cupin family protein
MALHGFDVLVRRRERVAHGRAIRPVAQQSRTTCIGASGLEDDVGRDPEQPGAFDGSRAFLEQSHEGVLYSVGSEIGVAGRDLRLRRLVVQPGGVVPFHSHQGRPALIITVSGEITGHRTSCAIPIVHRAGEVSREADGIGHYWVNHGSVAAVLLSADVKAQD